MSLYFVGITFCTDRHIYVTKGSSLYPIRRASAGWAAELWTEAAKANFFAPFAPCLLLESARTNPHWGLTHQSSIEGWAHSQQESYFNTLVNLVSLKLPWEEREMSKNSISWTLLWCIRIWSPIFSFWGTAWVISLAPPHFSSRTLDRVMLALNPVWAGVGSRGYIHCAFSVIQNVHCSHLHIENAFLMVFKSGMKRLYCKNSDIIEKKWVSVLSRKVDVQSCAAVFWLWPPRRSLFLTSVQRLLLFFPDILAFEYILYKKDQNSQTLSCA